MSEIGMCNFCALCRDWHTWANIRWPGQLAFAMRPSTTYLSIRAPAQTIRSLSICVQKLDSTTRLCKTYCTEWSRCQPKWSGHWEHVYTFTKYHLLQYNHRSGSQLRRSGHWVHLYTCTEYNLQHTHQSGSQPRWSGHWVLYMCTVVQNAIYNILIDLRASPDDWVHVSRCLTLQQNHVQHTVLIYQDASPNDQVIEYMCTLVQNILYQFASAMRPSTTYRTHRSGSQPRRSGNWVLVYTCTEYHLQHPYQSADNQVIEYMCT
jgi:hypothetical protein